jgi:hypothetical protein
MNNQIVRSFSAKPVLLRSMPVIDEEYQIVGKPDNRKPDIKFGYRLSKTMKNWKTTRLSQFGASRETARYADLPEIE